MRYGICSLSLNQRAGNRSFTSRARQQVVSSEPAKRSLTVAGPEYQRLILAPVFLSRILRLVADDIARVRDIPVTPFIV